jgi:predicted adenylyl cyclase CyaB
VARNVEAKAPLPELGAARATAERLGARFEWVDDQIDRYYEVGEGMRVKLRTCERAPAELIRYTRPETTGVRASEYEVLPVRDAEAEACLVPKTRPIVVVRKRRELWLLDNVRIHLDTVDGLGTFLELEAVVDERHDEVHCHEQTRRILTAFGLAETDCLRASYSDLLRA